MLSPEEYQEFITAGTIQDKIQMLDIDQFMPLLRKASQDVNFRKWLDPEFSRIEHVDNMVSDLEPTLNLDAVELQKLRSYLY